jgi:C4-dicarboxylate transporter DctM subunit
VPIFFPVVTQLGFDPVWFGIFVVMATELSMITPPVGLNLFVTTGITGMSLWEVVKAAMPWLTVLLLFLVVITYVPIIATFLPDLFFGPQR